MNRRNWIAVLAICTPVFLFRACSSSDSPVTWDEPVYLNASRAYINWMKETLSSWMQGEFLRPLSAETINQYWQRHLPSPPLAKTINGLCGLLFAPFLEGLAALRSGSALCYALLFGLVILHLVQLLRDWRPDRNISIPVAAAGLALFINPRLFSHAGTANLDTIGMVLTFFTLYWFWRTSAQSGWKHTVVCGVLWGCAFAAKNTSVLALPVFALWIMVWARKKHLLVRFAAMQPIGALIFFAAWPWLWHDTGAHLREFSQWAGFTGIAERITGTVEGTDGKLEREFGQSASGVVVDGKREFPWHYSLSVIGVVLPVPTLLLVAVASIIFLLRDRKAGSVAFAILGAWMPLLLTLFTPVYDMERFLLLSMPFMAVLCGYAVANMAHRLSGMWRPAAVLALLVSYAPAVFEWRAVHPYEFSFFNAAAGRLPGAVEKGFVRSYWLQPLHGALPFVNERLPKNASLASEERGVLEIYREFGFLRSDIRPCRITNAKSAQRCDFILRREPMNEDRRKTLKALHTFSLDGVPLASVFRVTPEYVEFLRKKQAEARRQKRREQMQQKPPQNREPKARPRRKLQRKPAPMEGGSNPLS